MRYLFRNSSIGVKLFVVSLTTLSALGILGIHSIRFSQENLISLNNVKEKGQMVETLSSRVIQPLNNLRAASLSLVTNPNKVPLEHIAGQMQLLIYHLDRELQRLHEKTPEHQQQTLCDILVMWKAYRNSLNDTRAMVFSDRPEEAFRNVYVHGKARFETLIATLSVWQKDYLDSAATTYARSLADVRDNRNLTIVMALFFTIFVGLVFFWITRLIVVPIKEITVVAQQIAEGDLGRKIENTSGDEIGVLAGAFNTMGTKLEDSYNSLERKVKERTNELKQAKVLAESASQAKSDFLANMSHEIRTPINAILGFTEILKSMETDSKKTRYIDNIHTSGEALLNIINDILDLSKIEAGKMELLYGTTSIRSLFNELENLYDYKIKDKGLQSGFMVDEGVPDALLLDWNRLRQVCLNLLANAIKFTDKGRIRLSASSIVGDSANSLDLVIAVEDTGIGIPKDRLASVFAAFEQVEEQGTSQPGGTGLGLAISQRLVEMMGGELAVTSEVNKGTTFRVILHDVEITALETEQNRPENKLDPTAINFERATILIADDIDYNRELLTTYLEPFGFTFIYAENGYEVIEQCRKHHPALVLLDMKMPEMDGYEASKILSNDEELREIPVIAVTASALKQDEEVISRLCKAYLRKPVDRMELLRTLMGFLAHSVAVPRK